MSKDILLIKVVSGEVTETFVSKVHSLIEEKAISIAKEYGPEFQATTYEELQEELYYNRDSGLELIIVQPKKLKY